MKCQFYFLSYVFDILVVCKCDQGNIFNIYFHEQMFFQLFMEKGDTGQFLWEIIQFYKQYNFHKQNKLNSKVFFRGMRTDLSV